ncbi:MAG: hypothetical protein RIM99_17125 [Cyclobacteriaceae bacterium]
MRIKLTLCLILTAFFARSEVFSIKGIVKDAETDEAIPFAHVVIGDIISLSNIDGEFVISSHSELSNPVLQVSVMGYETGSEAVEDVHEFHTIYLKPSMVELEEVTIMSGHVLMADVFNRFHLNYEMSRQHMLGYYKEDLHDTDSIFYLAEGIVDIYIPPNVKYNQTLVSPIKTRKKVFRPIEEHVMFLKGNASDMAKSSIWRKDSFLSNKNRKNYDFIYSGMSNLGDRDVFIVEFEPNNSKGNTRGKIYIEDETLAIVKLEYFPIVSGNTSWKEVAWTEEFFEKNGIYELFRVSYNGSWEDFDRVYTYNALLVVNETKPADYMPMDVNMLSEQHSFFHAAEEDFSESFWEGYNHMKLDLESTLILNKQGVSYSY